MTEWKEPTFENMNLVTGKSKDEEILCIINRETKFKTNIKNIRELINILKEQPNLDVDIGIQIYCNCCGDNVAKYIKGIDYVGNANDDRSFSLLMLTD